MGRRAECARLRPALRAAVDVVDRSGTYGGGEHRDVEPDRWSAAHDQDPGSWRGAQGRSDGAPCVCEVVAGTGNQGRIQPLRQWHERLGGPRDAHQLIKKATPVSAQWRAVHRISRNPLALRRQPPPATGTSTAADVPRNHDLLSGTQSCRAVTD